MKRALKQTPTDAGQGAISVECLDIYDYHRGTRRYNSTGNLLPAGLAREQQILQETAAALRQQLQDVEANFQNLGFADLEVEGRGLGKIPGTWTTPVQGTGLQTALDLLSQKLDDRDHGIHPTGIEFDIALLFVKIPYVDDLVAAVLSRALAPLARTATRAAGIVAKLVPGILRYAVKGTVGGGEARLP